MTLIKPIKSGNPALPRDNTGQLNSNRSLFRQHVELTFVVGQTSDNEDRKFWSVKSSLFWQRYLLAILEREKFRNVELWTR